MTHRLKWTYDRPSELQILKTGLWLRVLVFWPYLGALDRLKTGQIKIFGLFLTELKVIEKTRKQRNLLKALKVLIRSILKLKHAFKSRRSFWPNLRFKQGRSQWDVKIAVKTCDTETLLKTCNTENPVGKTLTEKRKKSDIINRSHRNLNKVYPKVIVFQCELWKIGTKSLKTECALSTKGGKSASVLYVSTRDISTSMHYES